MRWLQHRLVSWLCPLSLCPLSLISCMRGGRERRGCCEGRAAAADQIGGEKGTREDEGSGAIGKRTALARIGRLGRVLLGERQGNRRLGRPEVDRTESQCLSHEGRGNTRQRQCHSHEDSGNTRQRQCPTARTPGTAGCGGARCSEAGRYPTRRAQRARWCWWTCCSSTPAVLVPRLRQHE